MSIQITGPLNRAALELSLNEVIKRYEAWRTSFPLVDGQPVRVVHAVLTVGLSVVDVRGHPETELLREVWENRRTLFDLAQVPLLRAWLVRLRDEDARLIVTLHHIIFYGFSLYQVFFPELHALYEAFSAGRPAPLAQLPMQYPDVAVWERQQPQQGYLAGHRTTGSRS